MSLDQVQKEDEYEVCESCGEPADWDGDSEPVICASCRVETAEHFSEEER